MTYAYIPGPGQPDEEISIPAGQAIAGGAIGILVLDLCYPLLPGNVANASSYNFPILYKVLKDTTIPMIMRGDPALLEMIVEGGQELISQGARAIIGACGYFANYQKEAAAALDAPVFLSSLLQVPVIAQSLKPEQKVGIICAVEESLTPATLENCGVTDLSRLVITGAQDLPEFQNILNCTGRFNSRVLEGELVDLARKFVNDNPDIGAVLLECSDMPPYAWAIQNAIRRPVFDFITLINWVFGGVVRQPLAGLI